MLACALPVLLYLVTVLCLSECVCAEGREEKRERNILNLAIMHLRHKKQWCTKALKGQGCTTQQKGQGCTMRQKGQGYTTRLKGQECTTRQKELYLQLFNWFLWYRFNTKVKGTLSRKANCLVKKGMSLADYDCTCVYTLQDMTTKTTLNSPSLAICQCFFCIQKNLNNIHHRCCGATLMAKLHNDITYEGWGKTLTACHSKCMGISYSSL